MEKRNCKLAAAVAAAVALSSGLSNAEERPTFTVVLHVTDFAGVDDGDFARARTEAQRIFADAGVRLIWVDIALGPTARACEGLNLSVSILSPFLESQHARQGVGGSVLGTASPAAGAAFIFAGRINELAARRRVGQGVLLGRVIAHEVGHLLLPNPKHSRSGLMTAQMDTDPTGLDTFLAYQERRAVRARLESKGPGSRDRAECGTASVAREP